MSEKEIDILASDIDYAITSRDISLEDRREIAKALVLLGYGKVEDYQRKAKKYDEMNKVWHFNEPMESVDINANHLQELCNSFDIVKEKAIKEFAERLKLDFAPYIVRDFATNCVMNTNLIIDSLLKEYGVEDETK